MAWMLLWAAGWNNIVQVPFQTEALCEAAKTELVVEHEIKPITIACVRVRSDA